MNSNDFALMSEINKMMHKGDYSALAKYLSDEKVNWTSKPDIMECLALGISITQANIESNRTPLLEIYNKMTTQNLTAKATIRLEILREVLHET